MKKTTYIPMLIIALSSFCYGSTNAQFKVENYWAVGEHNTSSGTYLNTVFSGYYTKDKFHFNSQIQLDVINPQRQVFSGLQISATRDAIFQRIPIDMSLQYLYAPFSETLRESNISIVASSGTHGFSYALGLNFRTYAYTRTAIESYNIEQQRYHENLSLIYDVGYTYSPPQYNWSAGIFITNYDDFLINQDMNPFLRIKGQYHFDKKIEIYTEANYIKAGVFNGSSNYFGYYIKTGIIWHID